MESNIHIFFIVSLGLLGLIFGSFSSVLIYRWKTKTPGILTGRSECPQCHHVLSAQELVPLFSFIFQKGKCANCKTKIPVFYPLLELCMGVIFAMMGYAMWKLGIEYISLGSFILILYTFITGIYIVYDIRYMEIPDEALIPGIYIALMCLLVTCFFPELQSSIFPYISSTISSYSIFISSLSGAFVLYTFFYLQILIPGGLYALREKRYKLLGEIFASYIVFPFSILTFGYFEKKEDASDEIPTWIGGGDLRVAIFIGLTLGLTHAIFALVFAYILGSIFGIGYIWRTKNRKASIAFGPFLGVGWLLSFLFYIEINAYIENIYYNIF